MIITVTNLLPVTSPNTWLTSAVSRGDSTLGLKALNQFNASWALQIGETGEAQTEIVLLGTATPAGVNGTIVGTALYDHPTDTPVYGIKYDQIVFERSISGTTGTASPLTGGTITIQSNGTVTLFDDISGSTSYAYRTYFRNSALNVTSPESDWITTSGYPLYSLASIRQRVKDKLFSADYIGSDMVINNWINEWLELMTNAAIEINQDYLLGSTQVGFPGTADLGTITASDYKQPRRVWLNTGGATTVEAGIIRINELSPNALYDATNPVVYFFGDNVMGRKPNTSGGTINLLYYKLNPVLVNDTDTLPVSLQGYSKSFVDYALAQAYRKDNKSPDSGQMEQSAMAQLTRFKLDMTPRNLAGNTYALVDEPISAESDFWY